MKRIFYCKKCKSVFSIEGNKPVYECPDCSVNMLETNMSLEVWNNMGDVEKAKAKADFEMIPLPMPMPGPVANMPYKVGPGSQPYHKNAIGTALKVIAIIDFVIALLTLIMLSISDGMAVALVMAVIIAASGLLILGMGEVVQLLDDIKHK